MEIRQLITFKRVAEMRSYTQAAESLALTQPTVSHQIRLLQEEIGQKFFELHGRKVSLTAAGETLLPMVERILSDVEDCKRTMENMNEGERGTVTIAAIGSSTIYVLPELLNHVRAGHWALAHHCRKIV